MNGSGHASKPVHPRADLVAVLDVDLTVVRRPEPAGSDRGAGPGRAERLLHPPRHGREKQRRVVLAGHDHDPVRPGAGKRGEGIHRVRVRREDALESRERLGLRAAEGRVGGGAGRTRKPVQLEGVAVQDEVGRSPAFRVERLDKQRELRSPAEVFLDAPLPRRGPAEAHVQIGDDRDQPG